MSLTACGPSKGTGVSDVTIYPQTTTAEPLTIGYTFWDLPIDGFVQDQANQIKLVAEALNVNLIFNPDTDDLSADGVVNSVEYFAQNGVDGIVVVNFSDESLVDISKICEDNEIPFIQATRTINNPDIARRVESNPFYVGRMHESDYSAAYEVGRKLVEKGSKKIIMFCPEHDDVAYEARAEGFRDACEEPDVEIVEEYWDLPEGDAAIDIVAEVLNKHPEADGIFSIRGGYVPYIIAAEEEIGLEKYIQISDVDINMNLKDGFEKGAIAAAAGGHHPDASLSLITLVNSIRGAYDSSIYPIDINYNMMIIDGVEAYNEYSEWCLGYDTDFANRQIINANDARGLCVDFNPQTDLSEIISMAENMSLEGVKERHRSFVE